MQRPAPVCFGRVIIFDSLCQGANGTTNSDGGGVATWMKLASRSKRCHKFEQFWVLTSFRRRGSTVVHSFKCQIIQERNDFFPRASWFESLEQPHVLICRWSCPACLRLWVTGMLPMRTSWVRNPFDQISLFSVLLWFSQFKLVRCGDVACCTALASGSATNNDGARKSTFSAQPDRL